LALEQQGKLLKALRSYEKVLEVRPDPHRENAKVHVAIERVQ